MSTNGLHGILHRFPNESHRVSSVLRFEKLRMEFEQSSIFYEKNTKKLASYEYLSYLCTGFIYIVNVKSTTK